jgi:hypothetical protein
MSEVPDWDRALPQALILVRCRRCHRSAAVWTEDAARHGEWRQDHRRRCRCDPPPVLPQGEKLEELAAEARPKIRSDGRAPVSVTC